MRRATPQAIPAAISAAIIVALILGAPAMKYVYAQAETIASVAPVANGLITRYVLNAIIPKIALQPASLFTVLRPVAPSLGIEQLNCVTGTANCPNAIASGPYDVQTSTSGIGNGADATDDTLFTKTMPANTLQRNGQMLLIIGGFSGAANGNTKLVKVFFAGTAVTGVSTFTTSGASGAVGVLVTRLSTTAVNVIGMTLSGSAPNSGLQVLVTANLAVADLSINTTIFKFTGASPVSSAANDILGYSMNSWLN